MTDSTTISLLDFISTHLGIDPKALNKIIITLLIFLFYLFIRRILNTLIINRMEDTQNRYIASKLIEYVLGFLVLVIIGSIWLRGSGLFAYIGILSAGLAIALQEPIVNLAGWFFILFRRPFSLGNRIEIGEHKGDVIDIRVFMFSLMEVGVWSGAEQSTGRVIHIPNGWVFKRSIANYNEGFNYIWNEMPVTITFESNWEKAKEILSYIIYEHSEETLHHFRSEMKEASRKYMLFYRHLSPGVWTEVTDYGVTLNLRYICAPEKRWETTSLLWETILRAFSEHNDIDFAYPTTRFFDNKVEGKKRTAPKPQPEL